MYIHPNKDSNGGDDEERVNGDHWGKAGHGCDWETKRKASEGGCKGTNGELEGEGESTTVR